MGPVRVPVGVLLLLGYPWKVGWMIGSAREESRNRAAGTAVSESVLYI